MLLLHMNVKETLQRSGPKYVSPRSQNLVLTGYRPGVDQAAWRQCIQDVLRIDVLPYQSL